ncbi:hypothetical protein B0H67DRAFT_147385 [Lasiosphaeris hirsuta]|uniref:Ankyrin repeat protein n=1 Tax=Lasiosphaeris hirsuta TaxID=260670 RepID=A0AA40B1Z7_9PEZI|nr:hypothetical protein B0H67DRAFT_147385 [Lasiosphaeris hirsuta]
MVLDAKREALGQDKDSARAALQTGLALLNGFGIEQDIPIALQSVRKSAALGCVPADMLLLILNDRHPDLDQPHSAQTRAAGPSGSVFSASGIWASLGVTTASSYRLLSPWGRSTMRHSAPQVDVALLGESLAVNDEYSAPSREDIGAAIQLSCQLGDLGALKSLLPVLNNAESSQEQEAGAEDDCAVPDPTPLHYLFMFDKERQSLDRALECLLPKHEARHHILESCCVETQRLDLQLPFFLAGTPLGFAVCAGSSLAVEALICAGANPLNRTPEQDIQRNLFHESPLEKAISYHQSDMLQGLWRASLSNPKWRCQLIDMCLDSKEPLFAKLCVKSRLERWINHRGDDRMAQQRMVSTLTSVAWELVSTHKGNTETVGVHTEQAFMRALAAGLGKIIELDGLETADDLIGSANEIIRAPLFSLLQELEKETLVHALLRIACEGTVPPRRATAYIKFGELAFPGISPSIGFQVLVASIRYHNDSLFSMMVTDGRYFDEVDSDGKGILHHIIDAQFSRLIPFSEVLELVKDRDATDESGETPLHHAVRLQYLDETAELISAGADPTRKLPDGDTILHLATRNLDLPMIRCLVDLGMPANETNGSTQTALHALFLHWQQPAGVQEETCFVFEVANLLLSRGASCSVTDQSGWTAVHALALWDDELVRDPRFPRLLKALDLTVRGVNGSTILHSAILGRRTRLVSELLRAGMSVDDQDHDGATALHALASCATAAGGRSSADDSSRQFLINIATELLKAKPNLALDDTNGSTALECIIMECYESFVSIRSQTELLQCVLRYCSQKTTSEAIPVFDILLKAFRRAVMAGRWIAVWELLTLPTLPQDEAEKFLRWPVGIRLLVFGIVRADVAVLRRFLGDGYEDWHPNIVLETGILDQEPDPRQLGILSERSKQWSLSKHMNWERGVPQQTVHRSGGSRGVLRELLEFFIKHQDLYKMGPLRPVAKDKVPNSWRIIDNLMITVVNEFKG